MPRAAFLLLLALGLVIGSVLEGQAAKRVALVIGNSAYQHTRVLANPKNDATAIAKTLKRIGFNDVALEIDLGYDAMRKAIRRFGRHSKGAEVALVFFAGHGLEVGGQNYLVPTDAKLISDEDLEFEAIKLSTVLGRVRSVRGLSLVILDACRNNPLGSVIKLADGVTRSVARGFSRIEPAADVLVAYAAKHGTVAEDGEGRNSPYTTAILRHLETPGLEINFLFRRVRDSVLGATGGRQEPFVYGSLSSEAIYLRPPAEGASAPPTSEPISPAAHAWDAIKETDSPAVLEAFVEAFSNSVFATFAEARLKELAEQKVAVGVFPDRPKPARRLEAGNEFQDCDACPRMIVLPAGELNMRLPEAGTRHVNSELKIRKMRFEGNLAVGKFEVTFDEWAACVKEGGCDGVEPDDHEWGRQKRPVIWVTWDEAKSYVAWLSKRTNLHYRLLSASEWEYAARAGRNKLPSGDRIFAAQSSFASDMTTRVGSGQPNEFGVHDLLGNVWEWVDGCAEPVQFMRPSASSEAGSAVCVRRLFRGGIWELRPSTIRSAGYGVGNDAPGSKFVGFRVARTLDRD